jgi:Tat protein translocase TatC
MSEAQGKMSFLEHLEELRTRLIRCALAVVGGTIVCWFFREEILSFLEAPLFEAWSQVEGLPPPQPLNFAGMLEPFIAYLKLSAVGGVFVASPVILYNLWRFVSPGLYAKERKIALPFVLVSTLLFVGGSISAYTVVFPIGFRFFLEFASGTEVETVEAEVRAVTATTERRPEPVPVPTPDEIPPPDGEANREPDAGTEADAGTRAGSGADAGMEEEADAGPETETDAGPPPAPAVPAPSPPSPDPGPAEPEQRGETGTGADPEGEVSWYEAVLYKLVKANCRELEAEPAADGGVLVRFLWHERECGPMPELLFVKRGDTRLEQGAWSDPIPVEGGIISREFNDFDSSPGAAYRVGFSASGKERSKLAPVLMVKDYLSFAIRLILAFGLVFELPVLISFLSIAGIVNYRQLLRFSRWFLVLAVVLGAILTPPDVITQILLAIPLMVLYFVSVLVAYLFGPKPDED